ncbi:TlpA family protein disulfide reductase [Sandaracinus amylolyticus]|uniref:Thioredoxin family protein n=1 Tax=Sandaracinus amylolyticus TaxID=927083 RepID=A0A0F6WA57_9BACT|nr:TlpA disulfide reductase family protein [Sandaracinus amylolyticus]AKF11350.1 thioredoxin family protein [Sandaracinus amylolyticus]
MSDGGPTTRTILRALGFGFVLLVLGAWLAQTLFPHESPLMSQPAPPLEGRIVAGEGAESEDRVSLESLRGRPVILDFWASWCPPCRASIPILSRLAATHADAGLVTLGVNVEANQTRTFVERAHRALRSGFPTLHDEHYQMQAAYGVESLPTLVLIDRRGVVRRVEVGVPDESDLDAHIRELLAENP